MVVDKDGFRLNVGIILANEQGRVFWGRRVGQDAWQFPQGGVHDRETAKETLYRELAEEVGLEPKDVEVLGCTQGWLRYRLPKHFVRKHTKPVVIGQKQKWFLLRLKCSDQKLRLDCSDSPEFDSWRWIDYWDAVSDVVFFKRNVYRRALEQLEHLLFPEKRQTQQDVTQQD